MWLFKSEKSRNETIDIKLKCLDLHNEKIKSTQDTLNKLDNKIWKIHFWFTL